MDVSPPGGNGMVAKLTGRGSVIEKARRGLFCEALAQLDAFDAQLAAKIRSRRIVDPDASGLEDYSAALRQNIEDAAFAAGVVCP